MIKRILIDHGHGGLIDGKYVTPGKRASFGDKNLYEGVCNRAQANLLNYLLSIEGIPSEIIAPENEDTSLKARVMRVNKIVAKKPEEFLLISIHSNAFSKPSARGWEIWTSMGETQADTYAPYFLKHFQNTFPEVPIRTGISGVDKDGNFRIITSTPCPAVLTEDGFMTNPDDFALLTDPKELVEFVEYKLQAILEIMGLSSVRKKAKELEAQEVEV